MSPRIQYTCGIVEGPLGISQLRALRCGAVAHTILGRRLRGAPRCQATFDKPHIQRVPPPPPQSPPNQSKRSHCGPQRASSQTLAWPGRRTHRAPWPFMRCAANTRDALSIPFNTLLLYHTSLGSARASILTSSAPSPLVIPPSPGQHASLAPLAAPNPCRTDLQSWPFVPT